MGLKIKLTLKELKKRTTEECLQKINLLNIESPEYKNLSKNDKKVLTHLVRASWFIDKIHYQLENAHNGEFFKLLETEIQNANEKARLTKVLFEAQKSMFSPDYHGGKIQLASGVKKAVGLNFYPEDLSEKEFHKILNKMIDEGKTKQVQEMLTQRSVVVRDGGELKGIDYVEFFPEFKSVADELEKASMVCEDERFKDYLESQVLALKNVNPKLDALADIEWAKLDKTKFEFTITRETYDDKMTESIFENKKLLKKLQKNNIEINTKDSLGARVGIVNKEGTKLLNNLMNLSKIAKDFMPFKNEYKNVLEKEDKNEKQVAIDVDLITLTGDEGAFKAGIVLAQNLPNGDKLSLKMGGKRKNVYHRQVRSNINKEKIKAIVCEDKLNLYSSEADHLGTICHENTHSLGPKPNNVLGKYSSIMEEFKADMGIYAFLHEFEKQNIFSEKQVREIVVTNIIDSFVKAEPTLSQAHRVRSVMIINRMLKEKTVWLNNDEKIDIDINKVIEVSKQMLAEVVRLQIDKDVEKTEEYVNKFFVWTKELDIIAKKQRENDKRLNGTLVEPLAKLMLLYDFEEKYIDNQEI